MWICASSIKNVKQFFYKINKPQIKFTNKCMFYARQFKLYTMEFNIMDVKIV